MHIYIHSLCGPSFAFDHQKQHRCSLQIVISVWTSDQLIEGNKGAIFGNEEMQ